jgi:membrane peptidoglycan carboxypeptidase
VTTTDSPPRAHERAGSIARWLRRGLLSLLAVAIVLVLAATIYMLTLPGVGDAPARARAIVAAHGGLWSSQAPPPRLAEAIVSVEDEHFYDNWLVNVLDGAGRAALAALHTSGDPGGSTIDQQLAKQLYGRGTSLGAVLREIGLGVKLALSYSKTEILRMYLNVVYYGNGYWGDVAAARGYFGRSPGRLDWAQASLLAGLPQAPSAYDPLAHYALAKARQRHVLAQLVANHHLTRAQAAAIYREPLGLR